MKVNNLNMKNRIINLVQNINVKINKIIILNKLIKMNIK